MFAHIRRLFIGTSALLIALLICFSLTGVEVSATEAAQTVTFQGTEYYVNMEDAAASLRSHMVQRETGFTVRIRLNPSEWDSLWKAVETIYDLAYAHTGNGAEGDYLHKHRGSVSTSYSNITSGGYYYLSISYELNYMTTEEQEAAVTQRLEEVYAELELDGLSEFDTVAKIYRWVTTNVVYDYETYNGNRETGYSAYSALINKTAVCQGYALLMYRMLLDNGIDARYISGYGNGGRHGWNIVRIGDLYYNIDATWDTYTVDNDYTSAHDAFDDYFLIGDSFFDTHSPDADYETEEFLAAYPMSSTDYTLPDSVATGICGTYVFWNLHNDGTLTIWGSGDMNGYHADNMYFYKTPWFDYVDQIHVLNVEDGITSIGSGAFRRCTYLRDVTLADSVTTIEEYAFFRTEYLSTVHIGTGLTLVKDYAFYACYQYLEVYFHGEAPVFEDYALTGLRYYAYYPGGYESWEETILHTYGGYFTWEPFCVRHDFEYTITRDATCTDDGYTRYDCKYCTEILFEDVVPAFGHIYDTVYVLQAPTCTQQGKNLVVCSSCGSNSYYEYPPATGHDYVDDVCTVCGDELLYGTVSAGSWTMSLDSVIYLNYYPTLDGFSDSYDFAKYGGVVIWTGESENPLFAYSGAARELMQVGKENCQVIAGMLQNEEGLWYVRSDEIFAKNLGDLVFIRPYVEVGGEYIYGGVYYYSPAWYCYDILSSTEAEVDTRNVCAALLAYGASAQIYFDYSTNELVTDIPAGADRAKAANLAKWAVIDLDAYNLAYDAAYIDAIPTVNTIDQHIKNLATTLTGNKTGITHTPDTLNLQGAIRLIACYRIDTAMIDWNNVVSADVLFWNEKDLKKLNALTVDNASYIGALEYDAENQVFKAMSDHILAKNLGNVLYFSARIKLADGTVFRSGLNWYSPEAFVADSIAGESGAVDVCKAIAVYSEMARIRFAGEAVSEGLAYSVNDDDTTCTITGMGTCADTEVVIPGKIDGYTVTSIGMYAFLECNNVISITIPDSVTSISERAFMNSVNLERVIILGSVTAIEDWTFFGCTSLSTITLPDSVNRIGEYAFYSCANLASITIPDQVTSIGNMAFGDCSSLTDVTIGNSVTSLGEMAFYNCAKLSSIHYGSTIVQWERIHKGANWDYATGDYTVYCTDGEMKKQ